MTEPVMPPDDELLAFIRGELTPDAERQLLARIKGDAELRRQLECLRAAAGEAFAGHAKLDDAEAFERLQTRLAAAAKVDGKRSESTGSIIVAWLRTHSLALQGALAVLVIAQAVGLATIMTSRGPSHIAEPAMVRGGAASCLTVSIRFKAGVREDQIGQWLVQYNATIVSGPTPSGLYQVRLPDPGTLHEFASDPQARNLAEIIQPTAGCKK